MSAGAALKLKANGLTNVAALLGGWAAWLKAGYPVEGEAAATATPVAVLPTPLPDLPSGEVAVLGNADAPVTIVEYSDFQ